MGSSMIYEPNYYPRVYYPNRRIIVVNRPNAILIPQSNIPPHFMPVPMNPYPRVIISPSPNMPNRIIINPIPLQPNQMHQQKRTIPNLKEIFGETDLTQNMLDKREQKKCSICLEDFEVGTKIIYLPCFHYYHAQCIETWVKNSDKCPLCNIEIKIPRQ